MPRALDVFTSTLATAVRLGAGHRVAHAGARPEKLLELYEFEACPFCRKVREGLSTLDLDAKVYPCPEGGQRFRPEAVKRGGKAQFPFLVDANTGKQLYESTDILVYLHATYGDGHPASGTGPLSTASSAVASLVRTNGRRARPSRAPAEPLELWSMEASPFCRIVREELSSLEIPYVLHNVAAGSAKRAQLVARTGKMMVPWLHDPNSGAGMFESADIVTYLRKTYAESC